MVKSIKLSTRGLKDLLKTRDFYATLYGRKKAEEIIDSIIDHTQILESSDFNFKKSGEIDQTFSHLKHQYRKLVHHHCKNTYREGNDFIYVVRVFDTRQDPSKNL
jgi:plasmid stabilization system protein ParE